MNIQYDTSAAAHAIGVLLHETLEGEQSDDITHLSDIQPVCYEACSVREPKSYRIMEKNTEETFEASFKARGIICQSNLPPLETIRPGIPGHRLRQSVVLTALGDHTVFNKYIEIINEIFNMFRATFPNEKFALDTFHTYEGHPCITFFNRYFSFRADTPTMRQIPFDAHVDPNAVLSRHRFQNMHHVEDNRVVYSRRLIDAGRQSFIQINPTSFKNGDIVEVHFSFVAFPMKINQPRRVGCVMHRLIHLNDRIRKESEGYVSPAMHPIVFKTLKRKQVMYSEDSDAPHKKQVIS